LEIKRLALLLGQGVIFTLRTKQTLSALVVIIV
jgi:hypothetical protein